MDRFRRLGPLSRIALLVAAGDLLTKQAAAHFLGAEPTVFSSWLRFVVVHNDQGAFGLSLGAYTWQLNLALTLAAIVVAVPVSRELGKVDPVAPRALGLIVGGAIGNLASLIASSHGVVDFIGVGFGRNVEIALNVADLAAYTGLALILRTGFLIVAELRRSIRQVPVMAPAFAAASPAQRAAAPDREVPRSVFRDDRPASDLPGDSGPDIPGNTGPRTPFLRGPAPRVLQFPSDRVHETPEVTPPVGDEAR